MNVQQLRDRYVSDGMATASPERLLVMLTARLTQDLARAETALRAGDRARASDLLDHARAIVTELSVSLRPDEFSAGPQLASLYAWMISELIAADIRGDVGRVADCRAVAEPLADAWRQAYESLQIVRAS